MLCCASLRSQTLDAYQWPVGIPAEYNFDMGAEYERLASEKDTILNDEERSEFAQTVAVYHNMMLHSGEIYFGLPGVQEYLDRMVGQICRANEISKSFTVFVVREEGVNASAWDNGFIYVNIGLLAAAESEGAVAAVLGHEISHALHGDAKRTFRERGGKKSSRAGKMVARGHSSRALELRADEDGFAFANKAGYDAGGCRKFLWRFESDYQWYRSQYNYQDPKWHIALDRIDKDRNINPDSLERLLMDHPDNYERMSRLSEFMTTCEKREVSGFATHPELRKIRTIARGEQLKAALDEADYRSCLRNALCYHIADQENREYLYYICESVRRLIMSHPGLRSKGLLTEESKDKVFNGNRGILHEVKYLSGDPDFIELVKKDPEYGAAKKPFETYQQAYRYFMTLSFDRVKSLQFTHALYELNAGNESMANEHLASYAQKPDSIFGALARRLWADRALFTDFGSGGHDLYLLESAEFYRYRKEKLTYYHDKSQKYTAELAGNIPKWLHLGRESKLLVSDSLNLPQTVYYSSLAKKLEAFKPADEARPENRENFARDDQYWRAREKSQPNDPEVLVRRKNFFLVNPEFLGLWKDSLVRAVVAIKPYVYDLPTGTYILMEFRFYDPVSKKYGYSSQEYVERYSDKNVKKLCREFEKLMGFRSEL
jgi:hypothetical protein